jgi:ribosomal protein S18 acetylase RimI-like enzyme
VVHFRRFRNTDPPEIRRLWRECGLGPGAAAGCDQDAFETCVFSQPFFDPDGLIVAEQDGRLIGYVHAGFGVRADGSQIDRNVGSVCAVMVMPDHRRQGIGRELVSRAESYLKSAGAADLRAGPAYPVDGFYFGLYGGSQPAGFLKSDPLADPFFRALGYQPFQRYAQYERRLSHSRDPIGLRLLAVRRSTRLAAADERDHSWWWTTRAGRLDALELALVTKAGGELVGRVTVVGLDFYLPQSGERRMGLIDLSVPVNARRKGFGQALLVELCRRVKDELISVVQANVLVDDTASIGLLKAAGFDEVGQGTVYRHPAAAEAATGPELRTDSTASA